MGNKSGKEEESKKKEEDKVKEKRKEDAQRNQDEWYINFDVCVRIKDIRNSSGLQIDLVNFKESERVMKWIKLNQQDVLFPLGIQESFRKAVNLFSKYKHQGIVEFYGGFVKPSMMGYLVDHCPLGNLSDYVHNNKNERIPISKKLKILEEISTLFVDLFDMVKRGEIERCPHLNLKDFLLKEDLSVRLNDFWMSEKLKAAYNFFCGEELIGEEDERKKNSGRLLKMKSRVPCTAPEILNRDYKVYDSKVSAYSFSYVIFELITEINDPFGCSEFSFEEMEKMVEKLKTEIEYRPKFEDLDVYIENEEIHWLFELMNSGWMFDREKRPSLEFMNERIKNH